MLDRLEVVVAVEHFPVGECPAVDFLVNGASLLDAIEGAVPERGGYGGLLPEDVLPWLSEQRPEGRLFRGVLHGVGPFLFEPRQYAAALAAPREVARPLHHCPRES